MKYQALFCSPPRILYGRGARRELPALLSKLGFRHALLVTDRFFTRQSAVAGDLVASLHEAGLQCEVTDLGMPDPSLDLCREVMAKVAGAGAAVDCVIGLGGGSNLDLAKALSVLLRYGGDPADYIGDGRLPGPPLPLVAIPTTSGTGSEITAGAILVGEGGSTKVALMANELRPRIAVVDPALTDSCPPKVTAEAGADALTHAIETFLALDAEEFPARAGGDPGYSGATPLTRLLSLESAQCLASALPKAYLDGSDQAARDQAAYGSLLASLAYGSAGLHGVHAIAYALADLTHASHGATNAVLLPYVMDELRANRADRLAQLARALDRQAPDGEADAAKHACVLVRALLRRIGLRTCLRDFDVQERDLERLVQVGVGVARLTQAFPIQPAEPSYRRIVGRAFLGAFSFETQPQDPIQRTSSAGVSS